MIETKMPTQKERGAILALMAITITALILVGGLAVDVGVWYVHQDRLRQIAEAASLAGSAEMPDLAHAQQAADYVMTQNGLPPGSLPAGYTYTYSQPDNYSYKVVINDSSYPTFLSSLALGKNVTIKGQATATVGRPVALGSPFNHYGTNTFLGSPKDTSPSAASEGVENFWADVDGYCMPKENGDEFATAYDFNEYHDGTSAKYLGCNATELGQSGTTAVTGGYPGKVVNSEYAAATDHSYYYVLQMPKTNINGPVNYNLYLYSPSHGYEDPVYYTANPPTTVTMPSGAKLAPPCTLQSYPYRYQNTVATSPWGSTTPNYNWPSIHDPLMGTWGAGHNECLQAYDAVTSGKANTDLTGENENLGMSCWPASLMGPSALGGGNDNACPISYWDGTGYTSEVNITTTFTLYDVSGPLSSPTLTQHTGSDCTSNGSAVYTERSGPKNRKDLTSPKLLAPSFAAVNPGAASWDQFCSLPFESSKYYILGVKTDSNQPSSLAANFYSLLFQHSTATNVTNCDARVTPDSCPRIFSKDHMRVRFSVPLTGANAVTCPQDSGTFAGCADLPLAEFPKEYAGRKVEIQGWDIGDGMHNVQLLLPNEVANLAPGVTKVPVAGWNFTCSITSDANVGSTAITPCPMADATYVDVNVCGNMAVGDPAYKPELSASPPVAGAKDPPITNRKHLTIDVQIPANWDPTTTYGAGNDWLYIRYGVKLAGSCNILPTPTTVFDSTTWGIKVIGTPIRVTQ